MGFSEIWMSYPDEIKPCVPSNGAELFDNQCAIRMGLALEDAGFDMSSYTGDRCWHGHERKHVIRAQELADWLDQVSQEVPSAEKYAPDTADVFGRQGIIFCRNFWGEYNAGDHIDLWNGSEMRNGRADYILQSEEVWFWQVPD